jgi:hypothetical protein
VRAPSLHVPRRAKAAAVLASAVLGSALISIVGVGPAPAAAAPSAAPKASLSLRSDSPAFVSNQSGVSLGVGVTSALPASQLSIEVTLYSAIIYRDTLREALGGALPNLLTPLGNPGIIPLDLKSLDWSTGSDVMLHLPVSAPDLRGHAGTGDEKGTGGVTLSIFDCAFPNCGGVYPLQVSLLEEGIGPIASFTTYLIVTPPSEVAGSHPLHFAWVMPLGSSPAITSNGSSAPAASDLNELETLESALEGAPNAAISLDLFPQFVEAIENHPDTVSEGALSALRTLSGPGGQAAILPGTFVPVDPGGLIASGFASAVSAQLVRARQVLQGEIDFEPHEYASDCPLNDASECSLDETSLGLLEQSGISRLILPSSAVQPLSQFFSEWIPTAPFLVTGSSAEAVASDPDLEKDLASTAGPALKAQEMLADLSIQYFDNTRAEQAVAVESPVGGQLDPAFLQAMLTGLSHSSIVHAVTLPDLFDTVSPGSSNTSPERRSLKVTSPASSSQLPTAAIQTAQRGLAALGSVLPHSLSQHGKAPLSDLILMAEGVSVSGSQRQAYLTTVNNVANTLSGLVSLPFGRTITMTSLQAKIPISIVSNAKKPFVAELSAASPGLGFPKGHTWKVTIYPNTNIVPILLTARTTGDFPLQLTLATTTGFVMRSGTMTIRSTAISGVAVALSIGAAAFLVLWWSRSILTKRRKKHKLRGAALAASALPGSDTEA